MTVDRQPTTNGHTITVRVPMTFRRFGGRMLVVVPEGGELPDPQPTELDNPLIRALARAFRWRRQLEDGTRKSLGDIVRAEKISSSYITRILRLSTLAPNIVESILYGEIEGLSRCSASNGTCRWPGRTNGMWSRTNDSTAADK